MSMTERPAQSVPFFFNFTFIFIIQYHESMLTLFVQPVAAAATSMLLVETSDNSHA